MSLATGKCGNLSDEAMASSVARVGGSRCAGVASGAQASSMRSSRGRFALDSRSRLSGISAVGSEREP